MFEFRFLRHGDLWIGLHEVDETQPEIVKWADCNATQYQDFATQPSTTADDSFCYTLTSVGLNWKPARCDTVLQFICEKDIGTILILLFLVHRAYIRFIHNVKTHNIHIVNMFEKEILNTSCVSMSIFSLMERHKKNHATDRCFVIIFQVRPMFKVIPNFYFFDD